MKDRLNWAVLAVLLLGFTAAALIRHVQASEPEPDLDAMIGQMLLVGFNGTSPDSKGARRVAAQIGSGEIGGVILMDRNIASPRQVRALTAKFREAGHSLPPFISVDQEGGTVQRLSARKGFKSYPTARTMARRHDPVKAREVYGSMAKELAEAGFNMNYGPVVDLNINRANPIIGRRGRSYGDDLESVLAYARAFILAHRENNILTSVKHFPGHGSSRTDSHKRFVDLSTTWTADEFEPYRVLAREGAIDTLMVGHLYHPAISGDERLPATLASTAIEGWIRGELEFEGVVITDDLGMGAISKHHTLREALVGAIASGNDILLFSKVGAEPDFVAKATQIVRDAVSDGTITHERIAQSYERIVSLKQRLQEGRLLAAEAVSGSTALEGPYASPY